MDAAAIENLVQPLPEIHARRDAVDVHEHPVAAVALRQPVEDAAADGVRVLYEEMRFRQSSYQSGINPRAHSQSPPKIIDRSVIGTPALAWSRNESRTPAAVAARSAPIGLRRCPQGRNSSQRGQNRKTASRPSGMPCHPSGSSRLQDVADRIAEEQGDRHQQ